MGLRRPPAFRRPMKRDLMEILCCPVCKGDLELRVDVEKDEILEGSLFCKHCNHRYEIKDGIPDLLPPDFKGIIRRTGSTAGRRRCPPVILTHIYRRRTWP